MIFLLGCNKINEQLKLTDEESVLDSAIAKYEGYIYKEGVSGGSLKLPLYQEPTSFNPFVEPSSVPFMYEGLLNRSGNSVINGLSDRVDVSADSLQWRFKLRKDLLWSDSTKITTDDVLFTYNKALENCDKSNIYYGLLNDKSTVKPVSVEVDKNDGIVFKFKQYNHNVVDVFMVPLLPKAKYLELTKGSFCDSLSVTTPVSCMVGSGPFILGGYAPFGRITFVRNPTYYGMDFKGNKLPYIDTIEFVMLSDLDEALAAFKSGNIDYIAADGQDLKSLKGLKNIKSYNQKVSHTGNMLLLNSKSPRGKKINKEVLTILSQSIDRDLIIDSLLAGKGSVDEPLAFWMSRAKKQKTVSVKKTISSLESLGFKKGENSALLSSAGEKVEISILASSGSGFRSQCADIISDKFKALGIACEVITMGSIEMMAKMRTDDWDFALTAYDEGNSVTSAVDFWSGFADSTNIKKFNALNGDPSEKAMLDSINVANIKNVIYENIPSIFLVRSERHILTSSRLQNLNPSPFGGFTGDISRLFINEQKN